MPPAWPPEMLFKTIWALHYSSWISGHRGLRSMNCLRSCLSWPQGSFLGIGRSYGARPKVVYRGKTAGGGGPNSKRTPWCQASINHTAKGPCASWYGHCVRLWSTHIRLISRHPHYHSRSVGKDVAFASSAEAARPRFTWAANLSAVRSLGCV